MTRMPIVLSDTAMVLLRRRIEVMSDHDTEHQPHSIFAAPTHLSHEQAERYFERLERLDWALLNEMWHLWMHPDIPVIRHLDWHIILDSSGVLRCDLTFERRIQQFQRFDTLRNNVYSMYGQYLIEHLIKAYKVASPTHILSKENNE